jgi:hypothetical protein
MLALEDGQALRLLAGIGDFELSSDAPMTLAGSPTRFGRIGMDFEPLDGQRGWRLEFHRHPGPAPVRVELPLTLGSRFRFSAITGAQAQQENNAILVTPTSTQWEATWKLVT